MEQSTESTSASTAYNDYSERSTPDGQRRRLPKLRVNTPDRQLRRNVRQLLRVRRVRDISRDAAPTTTLRPHPNNMGTGPRTPPRGCGGLRGARGDYMHTLRV